MSAPKPSAVAVALMHRIRTTDKKGKFVYLDKEMALAIDWLADQRRDTAERAAQTTSDDIREAQDWYRKHEKAIRAAGIPSAPDFMVPF